ncbi:hypothetical protein PLICRDRAFT_90723 [Plicaturopsis crispa FD-325 SS-3]|nr:hypothetical protein PLICRDRAFT_90723 [Plicaturopsis crispa FD-325 SS-3]
MIIGYPTCTHVANDAGQNTHKKSVVTGLAVVGTVLVGAIIYAAYAHWRTSRFGRCTHNRPVLHRDKDSRDSWNLSDNKSAPSAASQQPSLQPTHRSLISHDSILYPSRPATPSAPPPYSLPPSPMSPGRIRERSAYFGTLPPCSCQSRQASASP